MKRRPFNLNDYFYIKLKPAGFVYWKSYWDKYLDKYGKSQTLQHYKEKADKNGWVKFQAWEFLEIFGETCRYGVAKYFDINIEVEFPERKDL